MGSTTFCPVYIFLPPTELLVCYQPHRQKVMPGQKSIFETFLGGRGITIPSRVLHCSPFSGLRFLLAGEGAAASMLQRPQSKPDIERMGLLQDYQSMPSLRDVTVFCVHLVIDQTQTGASGLVRQGRRHGPSITYKITYTLLGHSPATSQGSTVLGQPSSRRPLWRKRKINTAVIGVLCSHSKRWLWIMDHYFLYTEYSGYIATSYVRAPSL